MSDTLNDSQAIQEMLMGVIQRNPEAVESGFRLGKTVLENTASQDRYTFAHDMSVLVSKSEDLEMHLRRINYEPAFAFGLVLSAFEMRAIMKQEIIAGSAEHV